MIAQLIPSMFHRRLLLIAAGMGVVMVLLGAQLVRLTVVDGAERRAAAERSLVRRTVLPTYRGPIVDRLGRKLAIDRPGYAVAVEFDVISGAWAYDRARHAARDELGRSAWSELDDASREREVDARLPAWRAKIARLMAALVRLGEIESEELTRRLDAIRAEVQQTAAIVWDAQRRREIAEYDADPETYEFDARPIREQRTAHVLLPDVSDDVAFEFRTLANELPGMFEVRDARRREHPWTTADVPLDRRTLPRELRADDDVTIRVNGVADHLLGDVRDVSVDDVRARPFRDPRTGVIDLGGYRAVNDTAGAWGLERRYERFLRGSRGEFVRQLDSGREIRIDATPGGELRTTIDIAFQARIQALLSHQYGLTVVQPFHHNTHLPEGWPLSAAVVVVEIETGEILAMVSTPTRATGAALARTDPIQRQVLVPWVNRPAEGVYPPGSIIKPLVLCAAVTDGEYGLASEIECTGHYFPAATNTARCWIYRERWSYATHGPLGAEEALGRSCNIFFYTLADRLGANRLVDWYGRFGLGRLVDAGCGVEKRLLQEDGTVASVLVGESAGSLPSVDALARSRLSGGGRYQEVILGIGQGSLTWTPLQAANAYATLARGGTVRDATLVAGAPHRDPAGHEGDLGLAPAAVTAALEGLRRSVGEHYGTGHHITHAPGDEELIFNAGGVTVWGKTGTAQAPPLRPADTNQDGTIGLDDEAITGLDHAWFVGLVGPNDTKRPMFAISVIIEYGGSGGRVSGPIANQIIHALQDEGYLPDAEPILDGRGGTDG